MSTVADALAGALIGAGVRVAFAGSPGPLAAALAAAGLPVVPAGPAAALMAAAAGDVGPAPGVAVLGRPPAGETADLLARAADERIPVIVVLEADPPAAPSRRRPALRLTPADAAALAGQAVALAAAEPPGPVALVVDPASLETGTPASAGPAPAAWPTPPAPALVAEAAHRLGQADRPLLLAGLGCRRGEAARWVRPLAEALPAPVLTTPRARGVVPDPHPLAFGSPDSAVAGSLIERADLVITLGLDAGERPAVWPPAAPVLALAGEVAGVIEELAPLLRGRARADWDVAALDRLRRERAGPPGPGPLTAGRAVAVVRELMPAGTIAVVDPGPQAARVMAAWVVMEPAELVGPPGLARPGFAPPAAAAIRLARPDRTVVGFTCGRCGDELETVARVGAAVVIVALAAGPDAGGPPPPGLRRWEAAGEPALRRSLAAALAAGEPALLVVPVGPGPG